MRPRFVIVGVALTVLVIAAWWGGLLTGLLAVGSYEIVMIAALGVYALVGVGAAFAGRFETARHIANGLPIWALCMTGLGMLLAAAQLHSLTSEALIVVFRDLVLAISPNIVGIALMAAIREAMHWSAGESV